MLYAAYMHNLLSRTGEAMAQRLRDERGALSAEYIALIVVVVAVLTAVAGSATEIGQAITEKITTLIEGIGGG